MWERGVGETLSCGTGACASVICGMKKGWLDNNVLVELKGGKINVFIKENNIYLSGGCEIIFDGIINV